MHDRYHLADMKHSPTPAPDGVVAPTEVRSIVELLGSVFAILIRQTMHRSQKRNLVTTDVSSARNFTKASIYFR